MTCQVRVPQGVLQGRECTGLNNAKYYSFEGIPYAKPPIGQLRFKDPKEPNNWSGIRDATKPGNKCAQMNAKGTVEGSEDCLYLNIYTPSLPHEKIQKLPVLFFIHGGRFLVGYGDYYRPEYFIRHDVILVTINYRLHILGFLCLNTPEVPGNAGLKDTIMALKWVRNNVALFNGDPNNVTVIGDSAGAAIATSYLTTKMADGLCHKIIGESGNCISDLLMVEEDTIEKAKNVAKTLNFDSIDNLFETLMNAQVEDLVYAVSVAEMSKPHYAIRAYFLPVVEKQFEGVERYFDEYPITSMKNNRFKKLPVIGGLNSHEAALFLLKDEDGKINYETELNLYVPSFAFCKLDGAKSMQFAKMAKNFYFKNEEIGDKTLEKYVEFLSDAFFNRDEIYFAEIFSKYSDNFYLYNFPYSGGMSTRIMGNLRLKGASHGDIIQYQFYRKNKAEKCTQRDEKIVNFLSECWCNFAKNGKPSWTNQPFEWKPYDNRNRYHINIDEEIKLGTNLYKERVDVWRYFTDQRAKL